SFFTRHRSAELVSRLSTDTRSATAGLETIVCTLFSAPLLIAFYAYLLARTNPRLVAAALAAAVLHYAVTRGIRGPVRRFATDQFSVLAEVASRFQEALVNVRTVKSFAAETFELRRLSATLREVLRVNVKFGVYKHIEEPARGVITIDGRDLRSLRQHAYRRLFGVVAQEPLLFNTTIRDNIAYGRDDVAEAEIIRAARVANAHDFIAEFPDGYDTVVGDR